MNKVFLIALLIAVQSSVNINCIQSKFVTLWTPKFVKENETLYVYYTTKEAIDDEIDINILFQKSGITHTLNEGKLFNEIKFTDTSTVNNKNNWKVNVTLAQNRPNGIKMCMLKIMNIKTERTSRNIFIQLDKPVYKPGDLVRFRVIVLDNNLKLYHANNIDVNIIDALGNKLKVTDDLSGRERAVIVEKFQLADETVLGDWKVEVIVEKQKATTKTFAVQKYVLPPFEVVIRTSEKHYHKDYDIRIFFHGRYSFEEYVKGTFKIIITKKTKDSSEQVYTKDVWSDGKMESLTWKVRDFPVTVEYLEYEVTAVLREPVSGIESNSTTTFYVHNEQKYIIKVGHPDKFQPNLPFRIKVFAYNWEGYPVEDSTENPDIQVSFTTKNGIFPSIYGNPKLINGVATYEIRTDESHMKFNIEVNFINSKVYRASIDRGYQNVSIDGLAVSHSPESPKIGDSVEIFVKSDSSINNLFVIYTTQRGNVAKEYVSCGGGNICKFKSKIDESKVPSFTVSVHQIVSRHQINKGKTTISTASLGTNELTFDISKKETNPFKNVSMKFKSISNSEVYILAFDKRLSYLGKGNDVTSEDIRKSYEDYDGENNYLVIDLNINNDWHPCSEKELKFIKKGRLSAAQHSNTGDTAVLIDDDFNDMDIDPKADDANDDKSNIDRVRQEFPETWIFESFKIDGGIEKKMKMRVPDAITTWMISAFAVNSETAIAVATPKELTVKMNFFIKINLPYSIRYKEILQVDVLVYNYVEKSKKLTVDVKLENLDKKHPKTGATIKEFEFIDQNSCTQSKKDSETRTIVNENQYPKASVIIAGDQLSENMNLDVSQENNVFFPEGCAQQRTDRFKALLEYYRYLLMKKLDRSVALNHLNNYHGLVTAAGTISTNGYWKYRRTTGYTAYFTEAFISAIEINAYNLNQTFIEQELDHLVGLQQFNGEFRNTINEFLFPSFDRTRTVTANYFDTAYAMIPLLKYKKELSMRGINMKQSYQNASNEAFKFLDKQPTLTVENDGLSMGAYAYALNNDVLKAEAIFDSIKKAKIIYPGNKVCYKVKMSATSCDFQHTVYVALAYIAMNDITSAEPIISYILEYHYQNKYYSNTFQYAIATEAIAKVAGVMKNLNTNLKVTLSNEHSYKEHFTVTNAQSSKYQDISLPEYTRTIEVNVSGDGYCAVSKIFEIRDTTARTIPFFKVSVEPIQSQNSVHICALYNPSLDQDKPLDVLTNVIYEVETPSGYTFDDVIDILSHKEYLRKIENKNKKTLVYLYFDQFHANRNYCVGLRLTKSFNVLNSKQSGIKVYNYDKKHSMAVVFYRLPPGQCSSI